MNGQLMARKFYLTFQEIKIMHTLCAQFAENHWSAKRNLPQRKLKMKTTNNHAVVFTVYQMKLF